MATNKLLRFKLPKPKGGLSHFQLFLLPHALKKKSGWPSHFPASGDSVWGHEAKTCTGRNQKAAVILFGLDSLIIDTLFSRVARAHSSAVLSPPGTLGC
jgi:hypothetical protein